MTAPFVGEPTRPAPERCTAAMILVDADDPTKITFAPCEGVSLRPGHAGPHHAMSGGLALTWIGDVRGEGWDTASERAGTFSTECELVAARAES